jgi:hypothetical protein
MGNKTIDSNSTPFKTIAYLAIAIPALIYIFNVQHYALNLPHWDDYDAILKFLSNYHQAAAGDKIALLFSQQNEHRILFSRIVYVLYYGIFGDINFRSIILFNVFILLGLFLIIAHFIKRAIPQYWYVAAAALSFAMFDLNNFENADFAMAGLQNYGIILLFMGSIFCYCMQSNKYLVPAVLLQTLCVFSSGNGNIGAFFIVLFVLLSRSKPKIIAALSTFLIISPLYYLHYHQPETNFFTMDPGKFMPFFLHAIAAHFDNEGGILIGIILLPLLAVMLPFGKKMIIKNNSLPLLCLTGFILSSMGAMSVFRGNTDIGNSYSSRYFIYSHMLTAILFVFIIIRLHDKKKILVPVMILWGVLTIFIYQRNTAYGKGGFEWMQASLKNYEYNYPFPEAAKQTADESCRLNIYCINDHRQD